MEHIDLPDFARESLSQVAPSLRLANVQPPVLNLCVGVCRSGTTPINLIYGKAGFSSFYQPVKADFRLAENLEKPCNINRLISRGSGGLFVKESLGPYDKWESSINFLDIYESFGFRLADIHLIIAFRPPGATFASWLHYWEARVGRDKLFSNFLQAERTLSKIESYAFENGMLVSYCEHNHTMVDRRMFKPIFKNSNPVIEYSEELFENWPKNFLDSDKIIVAHEPLAKTDRAIHETQDHFVFRDREWTVFDKDEREALFSESIFQNFLRRSSQADFQALQTKL